MVVVLMSFGGKILRFEWQPAIRTLPDGHVVVAIGDVHGHAEWLGLLHDAIARELDDLSPQQATVVHLGDLIDRGPDNMGALKLAKRGVSGVTNITLRGNHEDRLLSYLDGDISVLGPWLDSGGGGIFTQLKLDPAIATPQELRARIEEELMAWLEETPLMHREANLVFVHAGIDPTRSLDRQDPHTLMWTRKAWIDSPGPYPEGVAVIHGHIPRRTIDFRDRHRIDLDSGVSNWGVLSGLVIAGNRMRLLQVS